MLISFSSSLVLVLFASFLLFVSSEASSPSLEELMVISMVLSPISRTFISPLISFILFRWTDVEPALRALKSKLKSSPPPIIGRPPLRLVPINLTELSSSFISFIAV